MICIIFVMHRSQDFKQPLERDRYSGIAVIAIPCAHHLHWDETKIISYIANHIAM